MQFRELSALNAESLVLAQVEVQDVQLDGFHAVQRAFDDVDRHPMTARIEQQAAPRKTRCVFDVNGGSGESLGTRSNQLQQSLQSVDDSQRSRGGELCARLGHVEYIRLVLSELLNFVAGMLTTDCDRCLVAFGNLVAQRNPGGARELSDEAPCGVTNA